MSREALEDEVKVLEQDLTEAEAQVRSKEAAVEDAEAEVDEIQDQLNKARESLRRYDLENREPNIHRGVPEVRGQYALNICMIPGCGCDGDPHP